MSVASKKQTGRKRPVKRKVEGAFKDRIAEAFERERERELGRIRVPERETAWAHVFRCVCCGKLRGEQDRREPESEVCLRCVAEAGFWN
jgi:hypothetical protein